MHVFIVSIGSYGDVNPCIGLGRALKQRGHDVTLITGGNFEAAVEAEGLGFAQLLTAEEQQEWDRRYFLTLGDRRGMVRYLKEIMAELVPRNYALIAERHIPGKTLLVARWFGLGARIAQEKLGLPLVSMILSPSAFRSAYRNRRLPGVSLPDWLPPAFMRILFRLSDHFSDKTIGAEINLFREGLGLPPVSRMLSEWAFSPEQVLCFFPPWFAPPQPDWPGPLQLVGFPDYDTSEGVVPPDEVMRFLEAGPPPVVFTPGTWVASYRDFFEVSTEACRRLGRRGILLTRHADQLPPNRPETVAHFTYVAFSYLLPRAAALVHHGGPGSAAYALAAGIPQVVMPMFSDQPDNAYRLEQLGVARTVRPKHYDADRVGRALDGLLRDETVHQRCRALAEQLREQDAYGAACETLERFAVEKGLV